MRKLATVRKVSNIRPIEGASFIETCSIDGWDVVVKKNIHKEGDLVLFIEVDSLLDDTNPIFSFMKDRGYKVKTAKMRGQVSQGLILPLSELSNSIDIESLEEGDDLTSTLKIRKFEIDDDLEEGQENPEKEHSEKTGYLKKIADFFYGKFNKPEVYGRKGFPSFVRKTDEDRVQNNKNKISPEKRFIVTEKLDGTSATYAVERKKGWFKDKFIVYVCSRNMRISPKDTTSKYNKIDKMYNITRQIIDLMKKQDFNTIYVQGEILGRGIQGNKYAKELDFYAFTVNVNSQRHILEGSLRESGIKTVPSICREMSFDSVDDVIAFSNRKSILNNNTIAEGIVIRNVENLSESYKAINPEFLLKNNL